MGNRTGEQPWAAGEAGGPVTARCGAHPEKNRRPGRRGEAELRPEIASAEVSSSRVYQGPYWARSSETGTSRAVCKCPSRRILLNEQDEDDRTGTRHPKRPLPLVGPYVDVMIRTKYCFIWYFKTN